MLGINIADVIAVLKTMIPQLIIIGVVLVAAIIISLVAIKVKKPLKGFLRKEAWLAFFLTLVIVVTQIILVPIIMVMAGLITITNITFPLMLQKL